MTSTHRVPRIVPPQGFTFSRIKGGMMMPELVPLEDVRWVPAAEADHMRPDDPVLVACPSERSYALPWWVMKNHHAANLVLEERPTLVTLCERCSSAAAFDAEVRGERRTFQVIGSWQGTHVLADHETESIWTSFTGECIFGYHRGHRLAHLPLLQASWSEYVEGHPDTLVVDGEGESRDGHGSGRYPGSVEPPLGLLEEIDSRLPPSVLTVGIDTGSAARAYPLAAVRAAGGVVNDTVGGTDIVVLVGPSEYTGIIFERGVGERILEFALDDGEIRDTATGSVWDVTGFAVAGPLSGVRLRFADSVVEEWYAWAAYHPHTDVYGETPTSLSEHAAAHP